jgi:hypothetical protein
MLLHAPADRLLDQVLGETRSDAHPPAEGKNIRPRQLSPKPLGKRQPLLTRQR